MNSLEKASRVFYYDHKNGSPDRTNNKLSIKTYAKEKPADNRGEVDELRHVENLRYQVF